MSHFRGKSAGQNLKWGITIIYDLSVLIYQRDFYRTAVNILSRGARKARKSVIIAPYTCLPDSNNCKYKKKVGYNMCARHCFSIFDRKSLTV